MTTGEIYGVQSTGEMSQVKHFDAYSQETNRNTPEDDVIVRSRSSTPWSSGSSLRCSASTCSTTR